MSNEKDTESITLREMRCEPGKNSFGSVFPQGNVSTLRKVENLLKAAGGKPQKCGLSEFPGKPKGKAMPEYIITFDEDPHTIIVIECKKSVSSHESKDRNNPRSYAVDGVLFYSKFLKKEYNVIAIAVSGTKSGKMEVSTFHWRKGKKEFEELEKARGVLLEPQNYLEIIKGEKIKKSYSLDEIRSLAIAMHECLVTVKVTKDHKPIFIAGILIALGDKDFVDAYRGMTSYKEIVQGLLGAIRNVLTRDKVAPEKIDYIQQVFKTLKGNTIFMKIPLGQARSITWYIQQLELKIKPMMDHADSTLDALGVFYHEFVKYTGGDAKGLGIVLTPQHLTEFMCELAEVNKKSKVVDICCGSASFLITAMAQMFKGANAKEVKNIKKTGLYGVEFDEKLYSLAVANMIIRKDGKSSIDNEDCFDEKIKEKLKGKNINVGLINPPYSQQEGESELDYLECLLDVLSTGGTAVCVVPMSCALGTKHKEIRKRLFKNHTLNAVFSMPDDIFYPSGTVTCVMVWQAHRPHDSKQKTFFGYCKDDGFVKRKQLGRIDRHNKWDGIKNSWLSLYRDKKTKRGVSVMHAVEHGNEWCAEAYMATDYSSLSEEEFVSTVKKYVAYQFLNDL